MARRSILCAVTVCGLVLPLFAQTLAVSFDAVSVKPNPSKIGIRAHSFPADRFEATNVPVRDLIMIAYGEPGRAVPESLMFGGPSWVDSERFDVHAKGVSTSVADKQQALRRVLTDRFKLAVHYDRVQSSIYVMAVARPGGSLGRQLRRSNDDCGLGDAGAIRTYSADETPHCVLNITPPGVLFVRGQTMNDIAYLLTRTLGHVVRDKTGLPGRFDADAQFNPDGLPDWPAPPQGSPNSNAPSLFSALQNELGIKLEATRGPIDVLVIDHVEHPTAD